MNLGRFIVCNGIRIGPILLLLAFAFFMIKAGLGGNFTPFYFIGWVWALGAIFFLYLEFLQPEWYMRRWKVRGGHQSEKNVGKKVPPAPEPDFEVSE